MLLCGLKHQRKVNFIINQATILAGGRGERLRPITNNIPKPMAPIMVTPFLDYLIYSIIQSGIENILILLGYKGKIIFERYKDIKNVNIKFSFGTEFEKTGRRLLNAHSQLDENFMLLYGDNYWPIEMKKMWFNYEKLNVGITTTVFSNKNGTGEYGLENNVIVNNDGIVIDYDKMREKDKANGVDIGYFIVSKDILNPNIQGNVSFEVDILPSLIAKKQLGAFVTDTQYYYITNMKSLKDFESIVNTNNFLPLPHKYFGA